MALIKEIQMGQSLIRVYDDAVPKDKQERKKNLIELYDVINKIADRAERRGVDTSKWFYTSEQVKKLQMEYPERFI